MLLELPGVLPKQPTVLRCALLVGADLPGLAGVERPTAHALQRESKGAELVAIQTLLRFPVPGGEVDLRVDIAQPLLEAAVAQDVVLRAVLHQPDAVEQRGSHGIPVLGPGHGADDQLQASGVRRALRGNEGELLVLPFTAARLGDIEVMPRDPGSILVIRLEGQQVLLFDLACLHLVRERIPGGRLDGEDLRVGAGGAVVLLVHDLQAALALRGTLTHDLPTGPVQACEADVDALLPEAIRGDAMVTEVLEIQVPDLGPVLSTGEVVVAVDLPGAEAEAALDAAFRRELEVPDMQAQRHLRRPVRCAQRYRARVVSGRLARRHLDRDPERLVLVGLHVHGLLQRRQRIGPPALAALLVRGVLHLVVVHVADAHIVRAQSGTIRAGQLRGRGGEAEEPLARAKHELDGLELIARRGEPHRLEPLLRALHCRALAAHLVRPLAIPQVTGTHGAHRVAVVRGVEAGDGEPSLSGEQPLPSHLVHCDRDGVGTGLQDRIGQRELLTGARGEGDLRVLPLAVTAADGARPGLNLQRQLGLRLVRERDLDGVLNAGLHVTEV